MAEGLEDRVFSSEFLDLHNRLALEARGRNISCGTEASCPGGMLGGSAFYKNWSSGIGGAVRAAEYRKEDEFSYMY